MGEIEGTVQGHRDGHGFVLRDDGEPDIYLSPQEMHAVLHRDHVRVRVVRYDRKGRPEGRVVEILERSRAPIIGRLLHEGGAWIVAPEDKRYGQDILVPPGALGGGKPGQVVVAELTEPPSLHVQPVGRVTEVLGEIDDPGLEIEIAVRKYEVPHQFEPATLQAAAKLPDEIRAVDRKHRVDLTDVALVTIDGEDARDFDDAVYCEPAKVGRAKGWRLLVAIADVSHYVRPGEPLDDEAYLRATSVYFPRRVIPMLPEKLSNGLCSLNPHVDRLSMVCDMLITADGGIHAYQFYPAVICSHARLTYNEVAAVLSNTKGPQAKARAELLPHLLHLHEVYRALLKGRAQRGAVDFDTTETQIVCDEQGRIEKILPRVRNDAHRLIEEAMLAANVCSADFIQLSEHPALYRVHEGPTPEKKATLQNYLKALGLGMSLSADPKPAEFQQLALATRDRPDATQIHSMLLRSMQQAIYTPINSGHFGLAYEAYTHFTSPIRRYPDLLVHRVIKALLQGSRYKLLLPATVSAPEASGKASRASKARQDKGRETASAARKSGKAVAEVPAGKLTEPMIWEAAGLHCSANERRADEASRDVEAWLKCMFMRERLGEEYGGTIVAVTSFGLFVQLDELYVDGLVHISELGGDYWRFDEARQELRGDRTGVRHGVGGRLRVQVSRVDLDSRKIDFRLVREDQGSRGRERAARDPKAAATAEAQSAVQALEAVKGADVAQKRKLKSARETGGRATAKTQGRKAATKGAKKSASKAARKGQRG